MRVARIYNDDSGNSGIEDLDMPEKDFRRGLLTEALAARRVVVHVANEPQPDDRHTAPARQLVAVLTGKVEVECTDGTIRRFGPGELMLTDDTTGPGHVSRHVELPQSSLVVVLSSDVDVSRWSRVNS